MCITRLHDNDVVAFWSHADGLQGGMKNDVVLWRTQDFACADVAGSSSR